MTSKRTAASKRATLPRAADYAKSFLKDWERLTRAGRYDMNRLKEAMLLLIAPMKCAKPLKTQNAWMKPKAFEK